MTPPAPRSRATAGFVTGVVACGLLSPAGCANRQRFTVEVPETQTVASDQALLETTPIRQRTEFPLPSAVPVVASAEKLDLEIESNSLARDWRTIVLHHSGASVGSVSAIDAEHRSRLDSEGRPWLGIGYHFVIGNGRGMDDGEIAPTFRWRQQLAGAHAGKREVNEQGIGICLIGDFGEQSPTPRQVEACERLVSTLCHRYDLDPAQVIRHSDVKPTECPGERFPFGTMTRSAERRLASLRANRLSAATLRF